MALLKSAENIGLRFGLKKTTSMSLITRCARMSPNGMIYLSGKYMSLFPSIRFLKSLPASFLNEASRVSSWSTANGTESYQFDNGGRISQVQNPLGTFSLSYLGASGQITQVTPRTAAHRTDISCESPQLWRLPDSGIGHNEPAIVPWAM
jgi:hypothetical protein